MGLTSKGKIYKSLPPTGFVDLPSSLQKTQDFPRQSARQGQEGKGRKGERRDGWQASSTMAKYWMNKMFLGRHVGSCLLQHSRQQNQKASHENKEKEEKQVKMKREAHDWKIVTNEKTRASKCNSISGHQVLFQLHVFS